MTRFDFENAKPWDVSTATLLPAGNHVATITQAEGGTTKNGNPQIELCVANDNGERKDWLIYAEDNGVRKVAELFRVAGIPLTNEDQQSDGKLTDAVVGKLIGKTVGVVIREEDKYNEPGKKVPRIQGYVAPEEIATPAQESAMATAGGPADEDIPF